MSRGFLQNLRRNWTKTELFSGHTVECVEWSLPALCTVQQILKGSCAVKPLADHLYLLCFLLTSAPWLILARVVVTTLTGILLCGS